MGDNMYTISIKSDTDKLSFEHQITKEMAKKIISISLGELDFHSHSPTQVESKSEPIHSTTKAHGSRTSVREFIETYQPKRIPDKIATIALYLRVVKQIDSFSKTDLSGMFRAAADPLPKNISRDIKWTVGIGWISQESDGTYYLTSAGEKAVLDHFPTESIRKTRSSKLSPKKHAGRSKAEPAKA